MLTRSAVYYWNSVFVLLTACAMLAGCSSSPSIGDGQQAVQQRINSESEGRIKLRDFRKDNGVQGEVMGIKIYRLEFSSDCEFTEDCKWVTGFMGSTAGFATAKLPSKNLPATQELMEAAQNPGQPVRKGQIVHFQGIITFEKKEKGWAATGVDVVKATLADAQTVAPSLLAKAEKGDAVAQYQLGKTNLDGQGIEVNVDAAFLWFKKSAEQGYAPGENALGTMYQNGKGVETNLSQALFWFRKAVDHGNAKAQANLGAMYMFGRGVEKNETEAMGLLRKAAASNEPFADRLLGFAYEEGTGIEKNATEAAKWFEKAAVQGDSVSQLHLAGLMERGEGVPKNEQAAVAWYRKVASSDNKFLKQDAEKRIAALSTDPADVERRNSIACINNMKMIGLSFRVWAGDNADKYPSSVSVSAGGTMELSSRDADGFDKSAPAIFQVMSNELSTTKVVVCPSDSRKHFAADFTHLSLETVSYRVRTGANVTESNPNEILAICPIHGHVLYADGRVEAKK